MTDMKCPFCQQELESHNYTSGRFRHTVMCVNKDCKLDGVVLPKIIWQELIRTRKVLEQSEICCTEWEKQALDYKAENIALSGELERTRKALDVAVDALKRIDWCAQDYAVAQEALDKITALEQKDVK